MATGARTEGTEDGATQSLPEAGTAGDLVHEIAGAWERERPGTPVSSIRIVTPIWQLAKLFGDDRRWILARAGVDAATLDLLSVLRRSGPPYTLSTRELSQRSLVTAGAISQRVARAERKGLVERHPAQGRPRTVQVTLTATGHEVVEATVDQVLHREAEMISGLTSDQQTQLAELLRVLLQQVQHRAGDDRITHVGQD
ncbi:MarR family winged helix-turn-helix transcriptional regulator [Actinomadura macra]|uniref:MarR family winged helix-turn-helix transcriptional regulator n=1 Tax=Actinomadura macra TaxID=46164 RepID=UPI000A00EC5B|nr:MarR family winged helix-turn-helix transcriptional regulator [Actinomadura macra]